MLTTMVEGAVDWTWWVDTLIKLCIGITIGMWLVGALAKAREADGWAEEINARKHRNEMFDRMVREENERIAEAKRRHPSFTEEGWDS